MDDKYNQLFLSNNFLVRSRHRQIKGISLTNEENLQKIYQNDGQIVSYSVIDVTKKGGDQVSPVTALLIRLNSTLIVDFAFAFGSSKDGVNQDGFIFGDFGADFSFQFGTQFGVVQEQFFHRVATLG